MLGFDCLCEDAICELPDDSPVGVPGPYFVVEGQLFTPGAVAGQVVDTFVGEIL